jgi:PIN domain nuclease of toxin-antitoxin system
MKYLLDTHTFLWWCSGADQLSVRVRKIIADGRNEIYLSAASAWEIAFKARKGRLTLPEDPANYVTSRMNQHRFLALPIQTLHALRVFDLPSHHADPLDRLLVVQS